MGYASTFGRARASATAPEAFAICDRCGFGYNFNALSWQFDYRGPVLQNLRILVCQRCNDTPQEQLRTIVVPADPTPIINARPPQYYTAEVDNRVVSAVPQIDPVTGIQIPGNTQLLAQDGQNLSTQPIGIPADYDPNAIPPLEGTTHYGVLLPVLSISSIGTHDVTVTCSAPHNQVTGAQVIVEGVSNSDVGGAYNIVVTTAVAFTYTVTRIVPAGSLLTSTTRIITANIGLPLGFDQIPHTGV